MSDIPSHRPCPTRRDRGACPPPTQGAYEADRRRPSRRAGLAVGRVYQRRPARLHVRRRTSAVILAADPWFVPDPDLPTTAASRRPDRTPNWRSSAPTTATFAWNRFRIRGMPIPIYDPGAAGTIWLAAARSLTVVGRRGRAGRWAAGGRPHPPGGPRGDAHPAAPRLSTPGCHGLPEDAAFACERIVVGLAVPGRTPTTAPRTTTHPRRPSCSTFLVTLRAARSAPKSGG